MLPAWGSSRVKSDLRMLREQKQKKMVETLDVRLKLKDKVKNQTNRLTNKIKRENMEGRI